ncbi:hypothetical protein GHNINEIG_02203 [Hydrogenovibrio crunogenus]|uniref:Uncharacterized protein n=1 Tax=Hydrogenovibrio crunogenus TaxID=39765 RepID=A0A4P7P212_9GAMM|nr:hypothetical protein GHNINEIG_02203 [Hydrogenovibrio crunogenus]
MPKIFVTLITGLLFIALTGCSDHSHDDGSHDDGSHSHDAQEHHETIE